MELFFSEQCHVMGAVTAAAAAVAVVVVLGLSSSSVVLVCLACHREVVGMKR